MCHFLHTFIFSRDCVLERDVVVGPGSSVGTGSVIRNSVIGKQCVIGTVLVYQNVATWMLGNHYEVEHDMRCYIKNEACLISAEAQNWDGRKKCAADLTANKSPGKWKPICSLLNHLYLLFYGTCWNLV